MQNFVFKRCIDFSLSPDVLPLINEHNLKRIRIKIRNKKLKLELELPELELWLELVL